MLEDIHKSTVNPGFHTFFEILGILLEYVVFQIQGVKNLVFQNFWFKIPSILIEIQGFS